MFSITGITGKVGGETARRLLAAGKQVRAVLRNPSKGQAWAEQGCDLAIAEMHDAAALTRAFTGSEGVLIVLPPVFDPLPGFPEVIATINAIHSALLAAKPGKVVVLSTIGAQASQPNLLNPLGIMEKTLATLPMPVAFLRAAWFMENSSFDVASARDSGVVHSFLQPLDKPVPMIATADIGELASRLLQQDWSGVRTIELESAHRITPNEIGSTFAKIFGRPVQVEAIPRNKWEEIFLMHGMKNPTPRMQMIDGFNQGWIEFEGGEENSFKGETSLEAVLRLLVTGETTEERA